MKGYTYLKHGLDGDLKPKTIIRTEHISEYESFDGTKDYDYYIFKNDNMFHRCDENGKLGVNTKGQDRFLNYKTLTKEFEIFKVIEDEPKEDKIEKLNTYILLENVDNDISFTLEEQAKYINKNTKMFFNKINEIIDKINKGGE